MSDIARILISPKVPTKLVGFVSYKKENESIFRIFSLYSKVNRIFQKSLIFDFSCLSNSLGAQD